MEGGEKTESSAELERHVENVASYCLRRVEDFLWVFRDRNDNLKYGNQKGQHHGRK